MFTSTLSVYDRLVLKRPGLSLFLMLVFICAFATQLGKIKLDASADSLLLQGDPSLEFYREVSREYSSEDFLLITWQPQVGLLAPESLQPMGRMADELRLLPGVSSVVTVLDVPLLSSPPVTLGDITSGDSLPTLADPNTDRTLALRELTSSPIYAELLASRDAQVTAVQINLERNEQYNALLYQREDLRKQRDAQGLSSEEAKTLAEVEAAYKAGTALALEQQGALVDSVRKIATNYAQYADLFVGGLPMITADMVSFVRSDLNLFGGAILGIMVLVLAIIFRRVRWVVIPLTTCIGTIVVMLGILGALDWRMTVISSNFVAVLLIISLALAIHLIVRYRELHAQSPDGDLHERVLVTVKSMAIPCVFTGVTTIVAFMSLVVSGIQPVIDFGWMMTVGIVVALLLAFIIVPCMMLVWPVGRPFKHLGEHQPLTVHFARATDHHGGLILLVSSVLLLITIYGISRLEVENRFIDYFHESTEIYRGMELLDAKLGGTIPLDIVIAAPDFDAPLPGLALPDSGTVPLPVAEDDPFAEDDDFADDSFADDGLSDEWGDEGFGEGFSSGSQDSFKPSYWFSLEGMRELDAAHSYIDSLPETGKVLSLSTIFTVVKDLMGEDIGGVELALVEKSLPDSIKSMMVDPYFSKTREEARITVRVKETSKELRRDEFLKKTRAYLVDDLGFAPERVQFTGMLVLYNNVLQSLFRSQILTLGVVFLAILVMFVVLFRSFWLALIALAPNLLAAGLVLGVMGLVGIPLDIMTITIAAIVLGIGVDNCIHYVHRYLKEFPLDRDYKATMYRCHRSIGRALYYTTVTVVIGFSMLTLSNFNPSIYFGLLTVLAMAAAVIGALMLLPQLIIAFKPLGPEGGAEKE
ncbi:MAG: MMPL family transporter [Proteobacteria bacterium]|nr:MMPL family transporter [Pseudomonadota bacterium]